MIRSLSLQILSMSSALLVSACMAAPTSVDQRNASTIEDPAGDDGAAPAGGTVVRMLALHPVASATAGAEVAAACTRVVYEGGPLLTHVDVHPVFWNSAVRLQSNLNAFYSAVVTSPLFAVLSQYMIGFGTAHAGIVDSRTTANVTDATVQSELNRLITAGLLPAPTANTYYPVHFPSGMTITAPDGSKSCVQFCAYHSTFVRSGVNVNYGIFPDLGSAGCAGGCGTSTLTNNTDDVASNELVDAVTDPGAGLATSCILPPVGWIVPTTCQELGSLCNGQQGTIPGFAVEKVWSNQACACVDH
ncbi:MAG TPA: hypothetical protein VF516_21840 [Kofleriaceae bacterium]